PLRPDAHHVDVPVGGDQAGQGVEQGGLDGAVEADQRDPAPRAHRHGHAGQDGAAFAGDVEVAAGQGGLGRGALRVPGAVRGRGADRSPRLRRWTTRQDAAPSAAVTPPTGSSAGASAVRATMSARTRNAAPTSSDSGRSSRWPGPITSRTACGMTIPTNPMSPLTETTAAVP